MQFLLYVFTFLAPLSASFQKGDVTLEMVTTKVTTVRTKMEELSEDRGKVKMKMMEGWRKTMKE